MMAGVVNAAREAVLSVTVRGPGGGGQDIEAAIDTGFTGSLTLPPALIAALALPWQGYGRAVLADGSTSLFDVHEATVIWDGQPCRVPASAIDVMPLVGMSLMDGFELNIQVRAGGNVTLVALP
jgi:clan AA aspartic protease